MPNIKSQIKRVKTNEKSAEANKSVKSNLKTTIKKADAAFAANDANKANILNKTFSCIDKAAAKGIISKNTAAHRRAAAAKKAAQ